MTRVELNVRRLVVHGSGGFDVEAFGDALRQEVGQRVGQGHRISNEAGTRGMPPSRQVHTSVDPAGDAARSVAGRLFK